MRTLFPYTTLFRSAEFSGVDEERLAAPVAEAAVALVSGEEPQADRERRDGFEFERGVD
jgi:hypothetical protein